MYLLLFFQNILIGYLFLFFENLDIPAQFINEKSQSHHYFFEQICKLYILIIFFCTGPTSDGSAAAIIVSEDFVKSRGLEDRVMLILIYSYTRNQLMKMIFMINLPFSTPTFSSDPKLHVWIS